MVKTRAMHRRSLSKRRSYRRRVKSSACRKKSPAVCRSMENCKYVGKKRRYCRKASNKRRRRGGSRRGGSRRGGRRKRRAGNPAWGTPLVLLGANTLLKPKTVKRALRRAKL